VAKICSFVMFVFLDFHTAVCKQPVSILMHRCSKPSLALLTAIKRRVTENYHILLQHTLPHSTQSLCIAATVQQVSLMSPRHQFGRPPCCYRNLNVERCGPVTTRAPAVYILDTQSCSKADSCSGSDQIPHIHYLPPSLVVFSAYVLYLGTDNPDLRHHCDTGSGQ
jgi:hypothetical protein